MTSVKEDRVLDDETGTATIHVQDALSNQIKSGTTYETENLTYKAVPRNHPFRNNTSNKKLKTLNGPALLKKLEKEVGRLR